ncbi:hypothetical protein V5799_005753 [Amblyomma americanum]|uniref:Uncharacterized protein n=1 Tax=Amblyomma americanum TaxID=6943 RepID=A0AAQ4DYC6_AMBAM
MVRSCVNKKINSEGYDQVRELVNFVNGRIFSWPTRDWDEEEVVPPWRPLRGLVELAVLWQLPLWFRIDFLPKFQEPRQLRVVISPSPLATVFRRIQHEISLFEDAYSYLVEMYMDDIFSKRPAARAFETFLRESKRMQNDVFGNISDAARLKHYLPKVLPIRGLTSIANISPKDWEVALQCVNSTPLASDSLLLVTNGMILQAMDTIFRAYTARDIWFHTSWWFVQALGPLVSDLLLSAVRAHPLAKSIHTVLCVFHTQGSYGTLLAALAKASLPAFEQGVINGVLKNIEEVTLAKVRSSSRLNPTTRSALEDMINKTKTVFWPDGRFESTKDMEMFYGPSYNSSDSFFREWVWIREKMQGAIGTAQYGEASSVHKMDENRFGHYNPGLGVISMSMALLAPPFYYPKGTSAMLYGGLGFMYAEELVLTLNSMLCLLKDGKVFLTEADSRLDLQSVPCPLWCPSAKDRTRVFPQLDAADIAYSAYVRFRDEASDLPLKGLEIYSADQLFFITACHSGCYVDRVGVLSNYPFTVALKKLEPFLRTFSCRRSYDVDTKDLCDYI